MLRKPHVVRMASWTSLRLQFRWRQERWWHWAFLCCVLLFVAAVRFRLRDMPLERDEGEFAYGGQLLLNGHWPGQGIHTVKLPGTHAAYAVLMSVFGQTCAGVHLGFLVVNCAAVVLIFLFARALVGALAGPIASAAYAVMSVSPDALGTAAHATHFVVLFALPGLLLLWQAASAAGPPLFLCSGLLLGTSVLMKHNGLLFVLFGALWITESAVTGKLGTKWHVAKAFAAFMVGLAAPFLVLLLLLWRGHTLENVWFWSVTYARAYSLPDPGLYLGFRILLQRLPHVMELPFYAALLGLGALWLTHHYRRAALFACGFLLSSVVAVVPGFHFRPHYYVLLMPALALLTGAAVHRAAEFIRGGSPVPTAPNEKQYPLTDSTPDRPVNPHLNVFRRCAAALPLLLFAGFAVKAVARESEFFFRLTPIEACRRLYESQPFPEALVLAQYLREHSPQTERIAVLGSEPEIFFYSRRLSATGFIYCYPIAERQPFAQSMRQQMSQEIEAARPQFVVQVRNWTSWFARPAPLKRIDDLCSGLMPGNYHLIGVCEFSPEKSIPEWHWYSESPKNYPSPTAELLVFQRD